MPRKRTKPTISRTQARKHVAAMVESAVELHKLLRLCQISTSKIAEWVIEDLIRLDVEIPGFPVPLTDLLVAIQRDEFPALLERMSAQAPPFDGGEQGP